MKLDKLKAMQHDGPMPGQSWTNPRKRMPYDRPSEHTSVEEYLDVIFKRLTKPAMAAQFLALIDAGVPIDRVTKTLVRSMYGEGKINANMLFLVIPPLTVILWRMAEAAGLDPVLSSDGRKKEVPEIMLRLTTKKGRVSPAKVDKAVKVAEKSVELANMPKSMGVMKRPGSVV